MCGLRSQSLALCAALAAPPEDSASHTGCCSLASPAASLASRPPVACLPQSLLLCGSPGVMCPPSLGPSFCSTHSQAAPHCRCWALPWVCSSSLWAALPSSVTFLFPASGPLNLLSPSRGLPVCRELCRLLTRPLTVGVSPTLTWSAAHTLAALTCPSVPQRTCWCAGDRVTQLLACFE